MCIRDSTYRGDLYAVVDMIVEKTGLIEALEAQNTEEARGRIENIREFLGVVRDYVDEHELVPDRGVRDAGDGNEVELTSHEPTLGDFMAVSYPHIPSLIVCLRLFFFFPHHGIRIHKVI